MIVILERCKGRAEINSIFGSTEAPSKVLLLFFLLSDWLKSSHLKSRIEHGFLDIFLLHICSSLRETIRVTNNATSFGAKNVQKIKIEAAEMVLDPWNQREGEGWFKEK